MYYINTFFGKIRIFVLVLGIVFSSIVLKAKEMPIYFDAVSFKSDTIGKVRLDCYATIPFQSLKFTNSGEKYYAKYSAYLSIINEQDRLVAEKKIEQTVIADNYFKAQGGAADFDYFQYSFNLIPAKYKVRLNIKDELANQDTERNRTISLVDFNEHHFTLSGLMLVSKIEQNGDDFDITPYLSDNVAPIMKSFFCIFESYNKNQADSIKFVARVQNESEKTVYQSPILSRLINNGTMSNYFTIKLPRTLKQGTYTLRIYSLKPTADSANIDNNIVAGAERSISIFHSIEGGVYDDINKTIEQTRYAASSEELEYMRSGSTDDDKIARFDEFWKNLDPTPYTERNEAFDTYFMRVKYANEKYKNSSAEGWKSDMGSVLIVYGVPSQTERTTPDYRGRVYERWTYGNGKTFVFVDNNGFGDFRLYQPYSVSDKFIFEH